MQIKSSTKLLVIFLISLFCGLLLVTACEEDIEDKDPNNINVDPEQRREILRERHNIPDRDNPIFEAAFEQTSASRGDTDATGYLTIVLQGDSVNIKGEFSGLSSPYTDSFIHEVLQSDRVQRLSPSLNENKTAGTWEESYVFDKEAIEKLKGDSLYISVYSEKYEDDGEIRAQITSWDSVSVASPEEQQQKQE